MLSRLFTALPFTVCLLVAPRPAAGATTVACVGDSITELSGYPDKLKALLGPTYTVGNFGVAGTTLLKGGILPYWTSRAFNPSHAANPDVVVIMLGTNDSEPPIWGPHKGEFTRDYKALIASYRALPSHPRILLNLCLPAGRNPFGISGMVIETEIIPQIRQVAIDEGAEVIDLFSLFGGHDLDVLLYGTSDQVHPNATGAQKIAEAVYAAIVARPLDGGAEDAADAADTQSIDARAGGDSGDTAVDRPVAMDAFRDLSPEMAEAPDGQISEVTTVDVAVPSDRTGEPHATGSAGCSCQTGPATGAGNWPALGGLLLLLVGRLRRRRHGHGCWRMRLIRK
jgi:acyl-CoA thioesterase I